MNELSKGPKFGSLGADSFLEQHAVTSARPLHARLKEPLPSILLAILAKQKEKALPLYLECIQALDYAKAAIFLYVRTNNNTDKTEQILREWIGRVGHLYAGVEFETGDVEESVERYKVHEWNPVRFEVLGRIRNISLRKAQDRACEFYFVADADNFIRPCTLRELVSLNLPIVAPFLRAISPEAYYSNYHGETDADGYYVDCDQYFWLVERRVRGLIEIPVVHCTYLVRTDVIPDLTYEDGTPRHEYVKFSHSARRAGIPQYLDNRQVYGYLTFEDGSDAAKRNFGTAMVEQISMARRLLEPELSNHDQSARGPVIRRQFQPHEF